jgi:hypothetical protein
MSAWIVYYIMLMVLIFGISVALLYLLRIIEVAMS